MGEGEGYLSAYPCAGTGDEDILTLLRELRTGGRDGWIRCLVISFGGAWEWRRSHNVRFQDSVALSFKRTLKRASMLYMTSVRVYSKASKV